MNLFYDKDGKTYYGPYDYDLCGLSYPGNNPDMKASFDSLSRLLATKDKKLVNIMLKRISKEKKQMFSILKSSLLDDDKKKLMLDWITTFY